MSQQTATVLFSFGVVVVAFVVLLVYDLWAALYGGATLSQAWSDFGRANPIVIFFFGAAALIPWVFAAHCWWVVWRPK